MRLFVYNAKNLCAIFIRFIGTKQMEKLPIELAKTVRAAG
jgi:hypothetical protein